MAACALTFSESELMKDGKARSNATMTTVAVRKEYAMYLRESIRALALSGYDLLTQTILSTETAGCNMWRVVYRFKVTL
jgi:hypothetical protein